MRDPRRWVPVAEIARPHGVRGELKLRLFDEGSTLLLEPRSVRLESAAGARDARILTSRRVPGALLVTLEGVADRDAAEALRGQLVCLRRDAFPPPAPGEHYVCDLAGAAVEGPAGRFGTVVDVASYPTVDALVVETTSGARVEIPLLDAMVESVDADAGVVRVTALGVEHALA